MSTSRTAVKFHGFGKGFIHVWQMGDIWHDLDVADNALLIDQHD